MEKANIQSMKDGTTISLILVTNVMVKVGKSAHTAKALVSNLKNEI